MTQPPSSLSPASKQVLRSHTAGISVHLQHRWRAIAFICLSHSSKTLSNSLAILDTNDVTLLALQSAQCSSRPG